MRFLSIARFSDHSDVRDCRHSHLAFTLVSFERSDEGIEHSCAVEAERIDHGGHSWREGDTVRDPTRRWYAPALLDAHDRVDGRAALESNLCKVGSSRKRNCAGIAARRRLRPRTAAIAPSSRAASS